MKNYSLFLLVFAIGFIACNNSHSHSETKDTGTTISDTSTESSFTLTQTNPYTTLDQSPMDMIYWPADYPFQKMNHSALATPFARIIYSRPHTKGRKIFGNDSSFLCRYNIPWRLGANEATEFESFVPLMVAGKEILPGRYVMYAVPGEKDWQIIFNKNLFSWGLQIDPTQDVLRISVPVNSSEKKIEDFTMIFTQEKEPQAQLLIAWDTIKLEIPLQIKK